MFYRPDREFFFVNNLSHFVKGIRRGDPQARVIAGKFSGGDPGLIRAFMAAGMGDWLDILDVHTYSNDPRTGLDIGGVVASHETLAELGQGHKPIYLGEGWGPTRDLHQWVRTRHDVSPDFEEADFMRQYYQNGYRVLVTPRDDYNPEWMFGARFFTLNDNLGMTYWSHNAVPHYNEVGEIDYYLLSHLRFGDLSDMKPVFFNGGLVDFYGRPKGDWYFDFPPALPEVRVQAAGDFDYLLPGEEREVTIRVTNADAQPLSDLRVGIRSRTYKWEVGNGHLAAAPLDEVTREALQPGETWSLRARVAATSDFPRPVRIAVEVDYRHSGTLYCADDILRTRLREPLEVAFEPARVRLDGPDAAERVTFYIANNAQAPVEIAIPPSVGGIELAASPKSLTVAPGQSDSLTLTVAAPSIGPGIDDVRIGGEVFEALTVIRPMECRHAAAPPRIDGDLSDWPSMDRINSVRFGRSAAKTERPTWVAFPVPPPPKESAFESSGISTVGPDRRDEPRAEFAADGVLLWDETHLYLGFWVEDATHSQEEFGGQMWRGDSIQVALDPLGDGAGERTVSPGQFLKRTAEENYQPDDFELVFGLTRTGPQAFIVYGPLDHPKGALTECELAIVHQEGSTVYEAAIPWSALHLEPPKAGDEIRLDVLVNNFDGQDRYILGLGDGIGAGKYPSRFLPVRFVKPGE